ncbi:MAG: ABC transporter substrate-binding protein [Novosphingobium sp.]
MTRKSFLVAILVVLAVGGLVFHQFRGGSGAGSGQPDTVTIASIAYPYGGTYRYQGQTAIIQQQGWLAAELAKRGIKLVWFPVPTAIGGPLINESFAGKRIDFASYGDFPAIIAKSSGIDLRLLVPAGRGQNCYLVVRNGLDAKSIEDLKGKRIALHRGRPWELPFSKLAEAHGLTLDNFRIMNINPPASHAALAAGDVDAAFLLSDAHLLDQKGLGRIIWSTKQAPADWKMRAELFGRGDFVDANHDLTKLVVEAYVRAAQWSSRPENREAVIEIASRAENPRSVIEAEYDEPGLGWRERFSPLFDDFMVDHYRDVSTYTYRNGLVRKEVDVNRLLEPGFVHEVLGELKLGDYWQPAIATGEPADASAQS